MDTIVRCLEALWDVLRPNTTPYVLQALARAAMEAAEVVDYLLDPGLGQRRQVIRFWLVRASGARYLDTSVTSVDPKARPRIRDCRQ